MARSALATQQVTRTGLTPAFTTPNVDGHSVPNDGHVMLEVKNASAAPITVTVQTPGVVDGLAISERVVTVPLTSGDKMIGPFPPGIYNQPDGVFNVDFSAVVDVSVAAVRLA